MSTVSAQTNTVDRSDSLMLSIQEQLQRREEENTRRATLIDSMADELKQKEVEMKKLTQSLKNVR